MSEFEEIVEKARSVVEPLVDEYIILANVKSEAMIKLAHGEISVVQSWKDLNLNMYIAKSERIGIYTINVKRLEDDIKKAVSDLEKVEKSPFYAPLPKPSGSSSEEVDPKIKEAVESGDLSFVIEDLELKDVGDAAGMISLSLSNEYLLSSSGARYTSSITKFNGYIRVFKGNSSGQWSWTSTKYNISAAKNAIGMAKELAEECSKLPRTRFEPGTYRVLLGPMIVGNLMEEVASAASAGMVVFGMSFFTGRKPGDTVASENLTLKDVPLNRELPGFRTYDQEGVGTKDKHIIEKGVFRGFLHNSKTAKLLGGETTGNAGWIMPQAFNLEIGKGDLKNDEIFEALRNGYFLTNNWYTRFQNYLEGTFSTVTRDAAFKVEGGKPVACVERVRIADSLPRILKSVEGLTKERWPIEWWEVTIPTLTPYMLLSEVRLTVPQ